MPALRASASISALTLASLARGEIGGAVDDGDDVALLGIGGQAERILDAGVAAADDEDMLVDIFAGIVELILDVRQLGAVAAHQVGIALGADGQDHGLGLRPSSPLVRVMVKSPFAPLIALTSAL